MSAKARTKNSVAEIEGFVARGFSQSPANCRVLIDEIHRLRAQLAARPANPKPVEAANA